MSVYDIFISDWMAVLGREKFLVIQVEEYEEDPVGTMRRIFHFLNLGMLDLTVKKSMFYKCVFMGLQAGIYGIIIYIIFIHRF